MRPPTVEELLAEVKVDEQARRKIRRRAEPATQRHVIFFTPRSGSSWLHAAVRATQALGEPNEFFNPAFIRSIGRRLQANTLEEFFDAILRAKKTPNGVFTLEVTYFQFIRIGDRAAFFRHLPPTSPSVLLVRENIVAQAISLYKAVETEVFHANVASPDAIRRSQAFDAYDGGKILNWVRHIRQQERGFEELFAEHGIAPLRLSYERMFAPHTDPVGLIADHFGVDLSADANAGGEANGHRPLASASNREFERRFRAEHGPFLGALERERAPMLATLHRTPRPWFGWARRLTPTVLVGRRREAGR